jgi:predicted esterase YcpF (UPF0227 family)
MPGPPAPTHLLYLHGFRSSPRSAKAQRLQSRLAALAPALHWWCPQLPASPAQAMALIRAGTAAWPARRSAVVGSSLGGYYATVLAEETGWPAVLLNPAVDPARDLAGHLGQQASYHDPSLHLDFRSEHLQELRALDVPVLSRPQRLLAIIAKGDELLDWREMTTRYTGARLRLLEGSDHALSDFDDHLPLILDFLHLCD